MINHFFMAKSRKRKTKVSTKAPKKPSKRILEFTRPTLWAGKQYKAGERLTEDETTDNLIEAVKNSPNFRVVQGS